jgi:hypothetical protein
MGWNQKWLRYCLGPAGVSVELLGTAGGSTLVDHVGGGEGMIG